ncbi:hypothetical protein GCM10009777_17840 [Microbacterium pumilum]|uniref:GmrSD restriction endonucleases C-terminal domain-containing protein n=1 Tax=Microbacterium pumilum TaxID=344165 RepID=A0ABP5DPT2_9MICO
MVVAPSISPAAQLSPTPSPSSRPTVTPEPETGGPQNDAAVALAQLASLPVVSGHSDAQYDRDRFGQRWLDVDRNGCDTRNDTLGRDLLDPVFKPGTNDCKVLSGLLIDPYDGQRVDFVSGWDTSVLVQIDHVVALAWSWRHGAEYWTDEERAAFANDPQNLVAASEATNQSKSDSGPSEWLPAVPELRCTYVENFVDVLHTYDLGIGAADRDAAQAVLQGC